MTPSSFTAASVSSLIAALLLLGSFALLGPAERVAATEKNAAGFSVEFTNVVESIGVDLVPTELAQLLVPDDFILAGDGGPVTPIVVRTAHANISIDGARPRRGTIIQIGLVIVPPDFSGDINNYLLAYFTTDEKLAHHLNKLGVKARHVENIDFDLDRDPCDDTGLLTVSVPRTLSLSGRVAASDTSAGSFDAIWWAQTSEGVVRMETNVPEILIGSADLELTTDPNGPLGQLLGGGTSNFVVLRQFNLFRTAQMEVGVRAP
jgi:hypothetical protein